MSQALWPCRSSWFSCFFFWFSVVFLFFFVFVCVFFGFARPNVRMQRVESFHLFFSCQSMHMSKQRICKEECKKRTLTVPCSEDKHDRFAFEHAQSVSQFDASLLDRSPVQKYLCSAQPSQFACDPNP